MILSIHPDNPDLRKVNQVVECLRDGGVVIYPTDTVYSIGCSLNHNRAIERVAKIKDIKPEKADFSLVCYDLSHIAEYARISNATYKLMRRALPGPFTFILKGSSQIPKVFRSRKKTVGIRIPDNNIARDIVKELGNPIIATSVHDDDELIEYTTDPSLIHEKYNHSVDIVIDGGYGKNTASTIIDCTTEYFEIIRQGIGEIDI